MSQNILTMTQYLSRSKVRVFESAMEKLGRILSDKYKIKVIFRHDTCMTDGKTIYLPVIPDNASDEFLAAVQGFLDHEVAHIIFSDMKAMKSLQRKDKKKWNIYQGLEDTRIEFAMRALWRGAGVNLNRCNEWSLKQLKEHWGELSEFGKFCQGMTVVGCNGDDHWFAKEILEPDAALWTKLQTVKQLVMECRELPDSASTIKQAGLVMDAIGEKEEELPPEEEEGEEGQPSSGGEEEEDEELGEGSEGEEEGEGSEEETEGGGGKGEEEKEEEEKKGEEGSGKKGVLDVSDEEMKKDEQIANRHNMIKKACEAEMPKDDRYLIFTTEGDHIEYIADGDKVELYDFLRSARGMVNVLLKKMRLNLLSIAASKWVSDKRRGSINPKAIFRVSIGTSKRVFRQKVKAPSFNTAASLWIDHSGSMSGGKMDIACKSAILFGEVLDELGIPFEVVGYSTVDFETGNRRYTKATAEERKVYKRWDDLWVGMYKSFDEDWRMVRHRCANMGRNQKYNTLDGECVRLATARLLRRTEDRKILFMFNDGEPCPNVQQFIGDHQRYLKAITEQCEKLVELFAVGICSESVKRYYSNQAVVWNVADLPKIMVTQLDALLRKGKKLTKVRKAG
jgi:cobalamin biosynthesis protein CobT